jgi:hypothetical protein
MEKINILRKFVHAVIFNNRLNYYVKEGNADFNLTTLKEFVNTYNYCDNAFKQYVYEAIKNIYTSIVNYSNVKMDLTEFNGKANIAEAKDAYIKLETRLRGIFDSLSTNTTEQNLDKRTITFLKLIYTPNHFIPYKFYSLFELSRIRTSSGCIYDLKEQQKSMIICIYIIQKILVKHILIDLKFSPSIKDPTVKK